MGSVRLVKGRLASEPGQAGSSEAVREEVEAD